MSPRVLYRTVPRMKTGEPSMSEGERGRGGEGGEKPSKGRGVSSKETQPSSHFSDIRLDLEFGPPTCLVINT